MGRQINCKIGTLSKQTDYNMTGLVMFIEFHKAEVQLIYKEHVVQPINERTYSITRSIVLIE